MDASAAGTRNGRRDFIPRSDRNYEFMVESHAGVLDIFVNEFREAQDALGMFTRSHCDDMTGQELEGKVLVMSRSR